MTVAAVFRRLARRGVVLALAVLLTVAGGGAGFWWGRVCFERPGPAERPVTIVFPHGLGMARIAELLEDRGVLRPGVERYVFIAGAKLTGDAGHLLAGEYEFPVRASMREVLERMANGETVVRRLTVAEGLTSAQVLTAVGAAEGLDGTMPAARPAEGVLLPETYHYSWGDRRQGLLARMQEQMTVTLETLWRERSERAPESKREAMILASIVEKETAIAAERPHVAAVFLNRLRQGMRLQSDPTVVYGLNEGRGPLGRVLTRQDLATTSPYNTYLRDGLPPGPICNPGRASIAAVLRPDDSPDLYFVADGSGGHVFARTLKDHNRNVARWRELEKKNQK
ncbi:MAG: endolytic transglycosylase MltG [Alphaproteobacteria bacterium]